MPTLRPGLGPSLRSSRRTRTRGHSRAQPRARAVGAGDVDDGDAIGRAAGRRRATASVAGSAARLLCATMATSTSAGKSVIGRLSRELGSHRDGREEPLTAAAGQARQELAVQPHQLIPIVAGADRPAPQRALGERRLVTGGRERLARRLRRAMPHGSATCFTVVVRSLSFSSARPSASSSRIAGARSSSLSNRPRPRRAIASSSRRHPGRSKNARPPCPATCSRQRSATRLVGEKAPGVGHPRAAARTAASRAHRHPTASTWPFIAITGRLSSGSRCERRASRSRRLGRRRRSWRATACATGRRRRRSRAARGAAPSDKRRVDAVFRDARRESRTRSPEGRTASAAGSATDPRARPRIVEGQRDARGPGRTPSITSRAISSHVTVR